MQPDVAKAQADTVANWAREWDIEAAKGIEGAAEISYQLKRIAGLVRSVCGVPGAVLGVEEQRPPAAQAGELRPG